MSRLESKRFAAVVRLFQVCKQRWLAFDILCYLRDKKSYYLYPDSKAIYVVLSRSFKVIGLRYISRLAYILGLDGPPNMYGNVSRQTSTHIPTVDVWKSFLVLCIFTRFAELSCPCHLKMQSQTINLLTFLSAFIISTPLQES